MDNTSEQKTENQEKKKIVRGPRLNQKLKIKQNTINHAY